MNAQILWLGLETLIKIMIELSCVNSIVCTIFWEKSVHGEFLPFSRLLPWEWLDESSGDNDTLYG